jgi:hypothetical protein
MSNVRKRTLIVRVIGFVAVILAAFWPIITSATQAHVSIIQSLKTDNITTTGTVVSVGNSTIGNGHYVVTYAYDVPGFPRNGNLGSFEREQIILPSQMSHFHAGMPVQVVYSRALKGESRLQGYGSSLLFIDELLQIFKFLLIIAIPFWLIRPFLFKFLKRRKPALSR